MKAVRRAEKRLQKFDARGSACPVCGKRFRYCDHPIGTALQVLRRRVVEETVKRALRTGEVK